MEMVLTMSLVNQSMIIIVGSMIPTWTTITITTHMTWTAIMITQITTTGTITVIMMLELELPMEGTDTPMNSPSVSPYKPKRMLKKVLNHKNPKVKVKEKL